MGPLGVEIGTLPLLVTLNTYRESFQPLGSPIAQLALYGVGVLAEKLQHKSHQYQDSFDHHPNH
jgi:hypothetical protein